MLTSALEEADISLRLEEEAQMREQSQKLEALRLNEVEEELLIAKKNLFISQQEVLRCEEVVFQVESKMTKTMMSYEEEIRTRSNITYHNI